MGSEAEGPLFQAAELPTPRPPRYNSEILKFHVFFISSFFRFVGCMVWRFLFQKRARWKPEVLCLTASTRFNLCLDLNVDNKGVNACVSLSE